MQVPSQIDKFFNDFLNSFGRNNLNMDECGRAITEVHREMLPLFNDLTHDI